MAMSVFTSKFGICVLASAFLLCVVCEDDQPIEKATVSVVSCPSMLREGQITWRELPQVVEVYLNATNVIGESCVSKNISSDSNFPSIPNLLIQDNDVISVQFDMNKDISNNSTETVVISKFASKDGLITESFARTWNSTEDVLLDKQLLASGVNLLIVQLLHNETACGYAWKFNVTVENHECAKARDGLLCSGVGYCGDHRNKGHYTCSCCPGFVGKYCEERDACYGNPCQHGGFCVDISEGLTGNTYQCLCPHGYRGRSCEGEVSVCDKKPCLNEGTCHGNQTHYTCLCPRGFSGSECEKNINECLSNPCIHGVCEDGIGGYKCYCLPGYGGDHCEFEYDECDSSPCINGGACEDLVAGYRCHCGPGYKGSRCQIKVDLCTPNPCTPPAQCVDRGNNYSCICHPGRNAPGCTQHYDPCYPNPCQHRGTCWPSLDSYFCSCPPGYTGDLCEVLSVEALHASQPLPRTLEDPGEPDEEISHKHHGGGIDDDQPVDHWHNVYLAGLMLTLAGSLVVLGAIVCHCKTHKTYLTFTRKLTRSCSDLKQQKIEDQGKFCLNLRGSVSEISPENAAVFEATSSVDVAENLDAPLIV